MQSSANQDNSAADLANVLQATGPSRGYSPMRDWDMTAVGHTAHTSNTASQRLQSPNSQVRVTSMFCKTCDQSWVCEYTHGLQQSPYDVNRRQVPLFRLVPLHRNSSKLDSGRSVEGAYSWLVGREQPLLSCVSVSVSFVLLAAGMGHHGASPTTTCS